MSAADRVKQCVRDLFPKDPYLTWDDVADELDGELLFYDIVDESRWSSIYEGVIKLDDGFVQVTRSHGSTENQPNDDLIDCLDGVYDVEPYEVTVTKYRMVR